MSGWDALARAAPESVVVDGVELRRGSRVRLRPRPGADLLAAGVRGRTATIEAIEQELEGAVLIAVTVDDLPGRDLGRHPAHRFFFAPEELEPLGETAPRVLIAGIGNVFMADDGFGVEVVRRLAGRPLPAGVDVRDFGIRGMDLAYALGEGYDGVVFVDAAARGEPPGTLSVIEPEPDGGEASLATHGMDPVAVLRLARELGRTPARVLVVACEPALRMTGDEEDVVVELSEPVRAAVDAAAALVESLAAELVERRIER